MDGGIAPRASAYAESSVRSAVADIAPLRVALPSIDGDIDQLTMDLAALCVNQSEIIAALGTEDHEVGDVNDFEDELQVRSKTRKHS